MLNLCKPDSLYNEGMKILVYSERMAKLKDVGWHRAGTKIGYYNNELRRSEKKESRTYFTHTFTYDYEYPDDTVYFAYSYPYTYSDCTEDLNRIMSDSVKASYCKRQVLCETLAGNKCEYLTITSKQNPETMAKRKGVVITARVHPGESVGSWMMKGVLDFLTDPNSVEAELLRQNFVFKIVPMLNPDGVINGNYRCSLAGCDLNRRWKAPSKVLHPTIYHTK
jgi:murein tripeptide amidase MpaA